MSKDDNLLVSSNISNVNNNNLKSLNEDKINYKQLYPNYFDSDKQQQQQHQHDAQLYPDYLASYNAYKESQAKKIAETVKSNKSADVLKPALITTTTTATTTAKNNNLKKQANTNTVACHKKFSVGHYAHLLNEPVSQDPENITGEQIIDKYYNSLKGKNAPQTNSSDMKKEKQQMSQKTEMSSNQVDKIAANIVSSGKAKWKNSAKTTTNIAESSSNKFLFFSKLLLK